MKRKLLTALGMIVSMPLFAQVPGEHLDVNNTAPFISHKGFIFWDGTNSQTEIPINSGKSPIFAMGMLMSGIDDQGMNHVAAENYRQTGQDYWFGPIADNYSEDYDDRYSGVWKINIWDIQQHRTRYSNPGYVVPEVIKSWPANGDVTNGESQNLAPFYDENNNGIYEPELGDYPEIKGEQCILFMLNDAREFHGHSKVDSIPLGIEIIGMLYADGKSGIDAVDNSYFMNLKVRNKSATNYSSFRLGFHVDPDLGNYVDDRSGYDITNKVSYTYNGDDEDEGASGYGVNPPAFGMKFLNGLNSSSFYDLTNVNPDSMFVDSWIANILNSDTISHTGEIPTDTKFIFGSEALSLANGEDICIDLAFVFSHANVGGAQGSVAKLLTDFPTVEAYYISLGNTGCEDFSIGINQSDLSAIQLMPNPAAEDVIITNLKDVEFIYIYNVYGDLIKEISLNGTTNQFTLDVSKYISGMYLIELKKEGKVSWSEKLIIR